MFLIVAAAVVAAFVYGCFSILFSLWINDRAVVSRCDRFYVADSQSNGDSP